ncbi:MAG: ABC transporter substrate-binding protein [Planctomycetota bacterium]|nr:MAG: ABC transporter substrate-binding protein [Planctomycetota bacterium]
MRKLPVLLTVVSFCLVIFIFISRYQGETQNNITELNSVNSASKPARIVPLAPNLTEILFALGLGDRIVAVSSDSDYPPETTDKQKVGTFWQPNIEAIIASKPDLVITLSMEQQNAAADTLHKLGYRVLTLRLEKIEHLSTAIQDIGTATRCQQRAGELVKNITNQINDLKSRFTSADTVKVLWVVQVEPLRVAAPGNFISELIELAGGENAIGPAVGQYPSIGSEEILACGAQTIIQSSMGKSNIAKQLHAAQVFWSKWPNLPAVKNSRIYVVNPDTILRLGPRLPQGIELIARCLHPEMFTQIHDVKQ